MAERHRETERQKIKETEKQRDRETEKQRDRKTEWQIVRETERLKEKKRQKADNRKSRVTERQKETEILLDKFISLSQLYFNILTILINYFLRRLEGCFIKCFYQHN